MIMRFGKDFGGLAAGMTFGGLFIGLFEAIYRDVPSIYAMLLYGTGWGGAGIFLALLWAFLRRRKHKPPREPFFRGFVISTSISLAILVRFIVWRDVFFEAQDKTWLALFIGLAFALAVALFLLLLMRNIERRIATESLGGIWLWFVPFCICGIFLIRTQIGDERILEIPPQPVAANTKTAKPNRIVILVVADALRADALGCYGAKPHRDKPISPRIDQFAKHSRIYTNASAQASWTRPAMASIISSRHVSGHVTMSKTAILPISLPTIATELANAKVHTTAVVTNYNLEPAYGFSRGFAEYFYLAPARYLGAPREAYRLAAYQTYRLLREKMSFFKSKPQYFYRSGAAVTTRALEIIDAIKSQQDLFIYLHYMETHDPYFAITGKTYAHVSLPKPPLAIADEMRIAYRDEVQRFDNYFGMLIDGLVARDLIDRTTIIVIADHGEEFADHGGFYHGTTLYEELIHVPLIISGPAIAPGQDDRLVRQIDIAPTIAGRFGVKAPKSWEGLDIYAGTRKPTVSLAEENHQGNILKAIRAGVEKLIVANPDNPRGLKPVELYNLIEDPREKYPIINEESMKSLQKMLKQAITNASNGAPLINHHAQDAADQAELRALGYIQ